MKKNNSKLNFKLIYNFFILGYTDSDLIGVLWGLFFIGAGIFVMLIKEIVTKTTIVTGNEAVITGFVIFIIGIICLINAFFKFKEKYHPVKPKKKFKGRIRNI